MMLCFMAFAADAFTISAFAAAAVAGVMHIIESMPFPYDPELSRPKVHRRIPGHSGHPHPYPYVDRINSSSRTI